MYKKIQLIPILVSTLVPALASSQSSLEIVKALQEVKSSLYGQVEAGVVNVQVVRQDQPAALVSALQQGLTRVQSAAFRGRKISSEEMDLWGNWGNSFLIFVQDHFMESLNEETSSTAPSEWESRFAEIYDAWAERALEDTDSSSEEYLLFKEALDLLIKGLVTSLQARKIPRLQPAVLRQGTGFIVEPGVVVTTQDVASIKHPREWIRVSLGSEVTFCTGELVGHDAETNVAVVRLASPGSEIKPTLSLSRTGKAPVGSYLYSFYYAFNQPLSMCSGEVTGGNRRLPIFHCASFFETSLPTSPGMMGSPLVNCEGELVGMRTVFMGHGSMSEVTYALPAEQLHAVVDQILRHGSVERGCLGVFVDELVIGFGPGKRIVMVKKILPESPAYRGGLRIGDIITSLNGRSVHCRTTLLTALSLHRPNDKVDLSVEREGEEETFTISLAPLPEYSKQ